MPTLSLQDFDTIRRTTQEVIQRPEYQLDPNVDDTAFRELWMKLLYWLLKPLQWLLDVTSGLPTVLRWLIVGGLLLILVLLIAHIAYTLITSIRTDGQPSSFASSTSHVVDPNTLEQLSREAADQGDYLSATRHLLLACLLRLQANDERPFRPGMTNREYLARFRSSSFVESLALLVEVVDTRWYGGKECREQDYEACHAAYSRIQQQLLKGAADAHVA